ncbi:undecaprenyl-diphosphate phosphatase [Palleronia sp. LCG004]|uniref:undecaprenyl-diphosphate phosphatase n=1 Tax=Palleronia sp. LCG004 TaxID=3079304 RepID=UPI002942F8E9|nr:undecaprenyl-diphosphate phosphatase [Palleronia sp. LCG004]WOI56399.1 undecaprenyl-diphosphate phosphatase [Palleronia sp. LCG004]
MPILHLFLVALVQGITEFLPVSSSGHLILLPILTGLADQGLAIDVAAHVGTLGAVVVMFWSDIRGALLGVPRLLRGRVDTQGAWLALCLAIATVPVILAGLALTILGLGEAMRSVAVIGWSTIIFGLVLYWADRSGSTYRKAEAWGLRDAVLMGCAQAIALIPGTSRSGIAITAGRALGYDREGSARIAMLMSVPVILASGTLLSLEVAADADSAMGRDMVIVALLSFVAALAALKLMFRLLRSVSFTPYVIYRLGLGAILLWIAYS